MSFVLRRNLATMRIARDEHGVTTARVPILLNYFELTMFRDSTGRLRQNSGPSYSPFPRPKVSATHSVPLQFPHRPSTSRNQTEPVYTNVNVTHHGDLKAWPSVEEREVRIGDGPDYPHYRRTSSQTPTSSPVAVSRPQGAKEMRSPGRRRPSNASSNVSTTNHYPPPTKPLPPLPPKARNRVSSASSSEGPSSADILRFSQSSGSAKASISDVASLSDSSIRRTSRPSEPEPRLYSRPPRPSVSASDRASSNYSTASSLQLKTRTLLEDETAKKKNGAIYYLDMSSSGMTLATKHGNNIIKFWSLHDGTVQKIIKFTSYTDAQSRSRDYLIRSHAILSEGSSLVAIAVKFGRTIEIWNWTAKKCLQSLSEADRWTAGRFEFTENAWSQIALYHSSDTIDLYNAARGKKPFAKSRTIELRNAGLPFVPQYPELAISPTSPILVIAAGPRPPRMGNPPPDKEVVLAAWEIAEDINGSENNQAWKVIRPWQHAELETAVPSDLVTYGSNVASIWIPATFRAVQNAKKDGYVLSSVAVSHKVILTWDLTTNATRTFTIPNATACVSPDCRFVAYCDASGGISARGTLAIVDLATEKEVWTWPDRDATAGEIERMSQGGFGQFEHLGRVTELSFSSDGGALVVGDSEGRSGVYEIRGSGVSGGKVDLYAV